MSQQPEEKKSYTVTYRATVNVCHVIEAGSPEEAYRIAEATAWNDGDIEADEIHAITVSYADAEGRYVHIDEADLDLEDDDESAA